MRTSDTLSKIAPDLVKALGELKGAPKAAENSAFKQGGKASKYATLESCIEATREILAAHNLCVIQAPGEVGEKTLIVTTRILHGSGEWMESDFHMPLTKWTPHEAGSATTYARRYALMAALNLAPVEDDDGNAASGSGDRAAPPEAKRVEPTAPTLEDRAARLEKTLGAAQPEQIEKAWSLAQKLRDELAEYDPLRLDTLRKLYEFRRPETAKEAA